MINKKRNNGIKINNINNNFLELQANKLNKIKYYGQKVKIMLVTGEKIEGYITDYDVYTILVSNVPYNNKRNNKNTPSINNNNNNNINNISNNDNDNNEDISILSDASSTKSNESNESNNAFNNINNTKINQKVIYKTSITYIDIL